MRELKGKRVMEGLTQQHMANLLQISISSYCRKENGKVDFSQGEIKTIYERLNLSPEELVRIFFVN